MLKRNPYSHQLSEVKTASDRTSMAPNRTAYRAWYSGTDSSMTSNRLMTMRRTIRLPAKRPIHSRSGPAPVFRRNGAAAPVDVDYIAASRIPVAARRFANKLVARRRTQVLISIKSSLPGQQSLVTAPPFVMRERPQAFPSEHLALFDPGQTSRAVPWHPDMSFSGQRDKSAFQKARFRSPP